MSDSHKQMATRLRADLAARDVSVSHGEALEIVAHQYGARDWNTLAARSAPHEATPQSAEGPAVPILRIFDRTKAVEFYIDYLGFRLDWEHGGHVDHSPLYAQVSRGAAVLHLSEHHGDASPGGAALIPVVDVSGLHDELHGRAYDFAKPGVRSEDWGRVMVVVDPFHNRLVFHQPVSAGVEPRPTEAAAPIEQRYELTCSPGQAFDTFTRSIDAWWDPHYAPEGLVRVEIEPHVGGAVVHHMADGTSYGWGKVLVWDRPGHYAQSFTLAQDPEHPSRLELWFEDTEGGCTMRFEHGGWNTGNLADRTRFTEWTVLLDRFAAVAERRPLPELPQHVIDGGS
jgi:catechol 2,3-dioxygenase-like lactoylglutathione lyase family enzyme